jgi:hypothetical protein
MKRSSRGVRTHLVTYTCVWFGFSFGACAASREVSGAEAGEDSRSTVGLSTDASIHTELCKRWAELQCRAQEQCCDDAERTLSDCPVNLAQQCQAQLGLDTIAKNTVSGFDADAADSAFQQQEELGGHCDLDILNWSLSATGLRGMFKGTLAPGQSCKPTQNLADTGTQLAAVVSCDAAAGVACLPESLLGAWTCTAKQGTGAKCLSDENCDEGTFCSNPASAPLGTCTARLQLGAACTDASQCESLHCRAGQCSELDQNGAYCLKQP